MASSIAAMLTYCCSPSHPKQQQQLRIISHQQLIIPQRLSFYLFPNKRQHRVQDFFAITRRKNHTPLAAFSSGFAVVEASTTTTTTEAGIIKIKMEVSRAKSEAIFDDVFSKMVSAAQPIPGFRRVKGGKTPNIPRDVLLQILGPAKVYKQVIKKIINFTVAEYVKKEKLNVSKDLRVEQSFEELEATFEPGVDFSFDVIIQLQEKDA